MSAAALLTLLLAATPAPQVRQYAVIVANNHSLTEGVPPLEYADDDAARFAELFSMVADDVRLLAVLDPAAQRTHREVAKTAAIPNRSTLLQTLDDVYDRIRVDRAAGHDAVFYFFLIGHGELGPGGEGFVSLLDRPFTRGDLYREVLARSPATTNHVIVDACNSYFMVHHRGDKKDDTGPSRAGAITSYLEREKLSSYPNSGVILSTSSAKESHEWSVFGAGVFSHELRSALTGAADASGDGVIDYAEVRAFIAAANARVQDPRARIDVYAAPPPIDVSSNLIDLRHMRFDHWLAIPAGAPFRFYLEDDRGVRYADVNVSGEVPAYVGLVPRGHYFARTPDGQRERRVELKGPPRIELSSGSLGKAAMRGRGSIADSFQRDLFGEPYGPVFLRGFGIASGNFAPIEPDPHLRFIPGPAATPSACMKEVVGLAHTRGIAAGDDPGLELALSTGDCARASAVLLGVVVDRAFVEAKVRRLELRAADDPRLSERLRAALGDLGTMLRARDYAGCARRLTELELSVPAL